MLLSLSGLHAFSMSGYMQIAQTNFPENTPFWEMLYYFHGNPPLLSILHHFAELAFGKEYFWFFDILLPILHLGSCLFFKAALENFKIKIHGFWLALLFLNPLIFIYFRYPFYACILFFLNSIFLFILSKREEKPKVIYWLAGLLSIEALLRSSYSSFLLLAFLLWLLPNFNWKSTTWMLLIMMPPFLWQLKNHHLVGKFTSSTWIGMNLARCHLPWHVHNDLVDFVAPFSLPNQYFEILKDEPRIKASLKEKNYYLSQNNLNHSAIPVISDLYLESIKRNFSLSWSANSVINGFIILFKSPGNYEHLRNHLSKEGYGIFQKWNLDFWEPIGFQDKRHPWYLFFKSMAWDPDFERLKAFKNITIYTILYPFLLIWFGFKFRKLDKNLKAIYILTLFFTLLYASVDIFEANRMRMEYEVFFYFLLLRFISEKRTAKIQSTFKIHTA